MYLPISPYHTASCHRRVVNRWLLNVGSSITTAYSTEKCNLCMGHDGFKMHDLDLAGTLRAFLVHPVGLDWNREWGTELVDQCYMLFGGFIPI